MSLAFYIAVLIVLCFVYVAVLHIYNAVISKNKASFDRSQSIFSVFSINKKHITAAVFAVAVIFMAAVIAAVFIVYCTFDTYAVAYMLMFCAAVLTVFMFIGGFITTEITRNYD